MMDYESLIERLKVHDGIFCSIPTGKNLIAEVTTALSTIQAENEKLQAELYNLRPGFQNQKALIKQLRTELEQVKAERDAAIDCIYKIVDAFD